MWMVLLLCGTLGALGTTEEGLPEDARQLQTLHCPPCEQIHCSSRRTLRLQCKGGVTTGVCGCCPVCARTEGETCGGNWDYLGKCDEGLVCIHQAPAADKPDAERRGVCKAIETLNPESCSPECTKEYCQANPSAICSASLDKKACQGPCQHTSCSSCLTLRRPSCPHSCAPSDPACLHRFGRCVHNHLRAHPACSSDTQ
uniref:Si:ch73-330k17.3 n=1 Tax=Fundulus heteroclitus TaxID=8078 RepID=A0A3Q2QIF0_FUNHE